MPSKQSYQSTHKSTQSIFSVVLILVVAFGAGTLIWHQANATNQVVEAQTTTGSIIVHDTVEIIENTEITDDSTINAADNTRITDFTDVSNTVNNTVETNSNVSQIDVPEESVIIDSDITDPDTQVITLKVTGPDLAINSTVEVKPGSTVYQVMEQASQQAGFNFITSQHGSLGAFVEQIGSVASGKKSGKYWIYYVNGKLATSGVSQYVVNAGDVIEWKFEKNY